MLLIKNKTYPTSLVNIHFHIQKGISLIESLVAIVVMALGVLGILGVQIRTLADNQTGVQRAQAIRLIEDLSERIQVNPNGLGNLENYVSSWESKSSFQCQSDGCNSKDQSIQDVYLWKQSVANNLPLGVANIFLSEVDNIAANRRQLGIMIGWRENEQQRTGDTASDIQAYKSVFTTVSTSATGSNNITCPTGLICHLQYIQPNQRCTPFALGITGTEVPLYCPN